jgi:uncharacterized protein YyaL (SSP411 family)
MRPDIPSPEELRKLPPDGGPDYNRLVFEKSPYLLQHSGNPIDWYPWGEAAFEKARRENKPLFVSIGYSTCHWCHVMERESFEDEEVAALMNERFVAVKVDREEREDVDRACMAVCVAMTRGGGWPLTVLMTPEARPFFAGTYFPKTGRWGRPGLMEILRQISDHWAKDPARVRENAERIVEAMSEEEPAPGEANLTLDALKTAYGQLGARYDATYGGFGGAPKFPSPHNLCLLLRCGERSGDPEARKMVLHTLRSMRLGGLFDHVGFGFHRYSTDRRWLVPHFEKMLYDQATISLACAEAAQAAGDAFLARAAREVADYVLRDMTSPEGGFYSAEDADSEGEEGKFYLWTRKEFESALGRDEGARFAEAFGIEEGGNFEDPATGERAGGSILNLKEPMEDARWEEARRKLFEIRARRVHPHKDDKILTAWNGLMIAALSRIAASQDAPDLARAASRSADFVLGRMRRPDGRLLRRFRDGEAAIPAFADDYAFLIWGLLELYEAAFDSRRLSQALELAEEMNRLFWDESKGGLFFQGRDAEKLFMRRKESEDGAIPSPNSVAALVYLRLGRITGNSEWDGRAERLFTAFADSVSRVPMAFGQLLVALDFALGPTREIVIAGDPGADALVREVRSRFLPRKVLLRADGLESIAPYTRSQRPVGGRAAAYVCENFSCRAPVTDPAELGRLLDQ